MNRFAAAVIFVFATTVYAQNARKVVADNGASAEVARSADRVVLSLTTEIGEFRNSDPGESIRVFGDGRVAVHRPAYRKDAGDFETRLNEAEMNALLGDVLAADVADFDANQAKRQRVDALRSRASSGVLVESSDPDVTVIEIDFDSYQPRGARDGAAAKPVRRTLRWPGLPNDAARFPEVESLRGLDRARAKLADLATRSDLARVPR